MQSFLNRNTRERVGETNVTKLLNDNQKKFAFYRKKNKTQNFLHF